MSELDLRQEKVNLKAHISKWQEDRKRLLASKEGIEKELAEIEKNINFAIKITGADLPDEFIGMFGEDAEEQETMVDASIRILREARNWIYHREVKEGLQKVPHLKAKMDANPNYYYTMMGRLKNRKDVERRGKKYRYVGE